MLLNIKLHYCSCLGLREGGDRENASEILRVYTLDSAWTDERLRQQVSTHTKNSIPAASIIVDKVCNWSSIDGIAGNVITIKSDRRLDMIAEKG